MLKKSFSIIIIIIILVISFGCSMGVDPPVFTWVEPAQSITFYDTDGNIGEIGGIADIRRAADEYNIDYYSLYLGTAENIKSALLGEIQSTGGDLLFFIPPNIQIRDYSQITVFTRNDEYESSKYVSTSITDHIGPPPAEYAQGIEFSDTDTDPGEIEGNITITRAQVDNDITAYRLYFANNDFSVFELISEFTNTGDPTYSWPITEDIILHDYTYFHVRTKNSIQEMPDGITVPITDLTGYAPINTASSISFTDTDPDTSQISGTVVIGRAANETDITHYSLCWGTDANTTSGSAITEIHVESSLMYNFANNTSVPAGTKHLIVKTKNSIDEMGNGISCSLIDNRPPPTDVCYEIGTMFNFGPGSFIIPMDIIYQDYGMYNAYGLVYQFLKYDIPVYWAVKNNKTITDPDFITSSKDYNTGNLIGDFGYCNGPFIIDSGNQLVARIIIDNWQNENTITIHEATSTFSAPIAKILITKPKIAVFADGNEDKAFNYLNAAKIPDSNGNSWPLLDSPTYPGYPDILDPDAVAGLDFNNHKDGALFDVSGEPDYTHILTMHWRVWDTADPNAGRNDAVVAEIREFLKYPTNLRAGCQSIIAIENSTNGKFLTPNGLVAGIQASNVKYLNPDYVYSQLDNAFGSIGGSFPSVSVPTGDPYYDQYVVMITDYDTPAGTNDIWITGYIYLGDLVPTNKLYKCPGEPGKVSYLGGHKYGTSTPFSSNTNNYGTRLILNALFGL